MCVCLLVCLLFIGHTRFPTLRRCLRVREQDLGAVEGGPAQASKHAQREHARACRTTSQRKNRSADAFQKQNRTRACCRIRNCRDFQKKGKNQHATSQVQFAFSWSVYFSNRTESCSSQIEFAGPHGITENQATYLHCGGEARAKKRARLPATCRKASTGKMGVDTGPEGCGSPVVFPSPCLDLQRLQS